MTRFRIWLSKLILGRHGKVITPGYIRIANPTRFPAHIDDPREYSTDADGNLLVK